MQIFVLIAFVFLTGCFTKTKSVPAKKAETKFIVYECFDSSGKKVVSGRDTSLNIEFDRSSNEDIQSCSIRPE